jgi:hypothetical protein
MHAGLGEQGETRMDLADGALWPLATGSNQARWAAQAIECYVHMTWIITTLAGCWDVPAPLALNAGADVVRSAALVVPAGSGN